MAEYLFSTSDAKLVGSCGSGRADDDEEELIPFIPEWLDEVE